jgi:hypothetical protein
MKQKTLATLGFDKYTKTTRRSVFLAVLERVVPWGELCALIEPVLADPTMRFVPIKNAEQQTVLAYTDTLRIINPSSSGRPSLLACS